MVDIQAIGRATGNGSGEIVEGLPHRDHEWEDDDETLQTRNYTGTREDVVAYCYPFDLNIPVGSIDPLPRSSCGIVTRTGSNSVEYGIGSTKKVFISQTRLEEAFSIPFSLDQPLTMRHYPTTPRLALHVLRSFLKMGNSGICYSHCDLTPTKGLGRRSAAYLAYTVFGTLLFGCIVLSSGLAPLGRPITGENSLDSIHTRMQDYVALLFASSDVPENSLHSRTNSGLESLNSALCRAYEIAFKHV